MVKLFIIHMEVIMSLKDEYQKMKINHQTKVILFQSGSFYVTFFQDAEILNYLLSYQIHENKVGFPLKNLEKVVFRLREEKLNYIVVDNQGEKIIFDEFEEDSYLKLFQLASKYHLENVAQKNLIDKIQYLMQLNPNYYTKIKEFIDEL